MLISVNGTDSQDCGITIPCRAIGFVLAHMAVSNSILKIESNNFSLPFTINKSFPIPLNFSLLGVNGRPVITADVPFQSIYLFQETNVQRIKSIKLRIENVIFHGIGIARLINVFSNISFQNCYFTNIITSQNIIRIEHYTFVRNTGLIHFQQCYFTNNIASEVISIRHECSVFQNQFIKRRGINFFE